MRKADISLYGFNPIYYVFDSNNLSKLIVIVQPVKRSYLKALSDGYLQEVKRLASKQISIG